MGRLQTFGTQTLQFARRWVPRLVRALLVLAVLGLGVMSLIGFVILRRQGDIPPLGPQLGALAATALFVVLLGAIWWVPRRQAGALAGDVTARERAELEDRFRRTLAGLVGGIIVVLMLGGALRTVAEVQVNAMGERFARATGQLSSEQLMARVAGVHSLEAIAANSDALRRPVYETLLAFVKERATADRGRDSLPPAMDVMAAVTAVSRRAADSGEVPLRPDFSGADLRGLVAPDAQWDFARLRGARLEGADLRGAHIAGRFGADLRGIRLDSANLARAHLDGANLEDGAVLFRANLRGADLDGAFLRGADLRHARLDSAELQGTRLREARLDSASLKGAVMTGATFTGASLIGTDFAGAMLRNANLKGTDLSAVRNLTAAQLAGTRMDESTRLPPGMTRPPTAVRPD